MNEQRRNLRRMICWVAIIVFVLFGTASAKNLLPASVQSARTVYIQNQTGNEKVLAMACDQFRQWGRFAISESPDRADLLVLFTHKAGMDKWGNMGITEMDVFVKGQKEPVFVSKNALKLIWDQQRPAKACIHDFRKRLEARN